MTGKKLNKPSFFSTPASKKVTLVGFWDSLFFSRGALWFGWLVGWLVDRLFAAAWWWRDVNIINKIYSTSERFRARQSTAKLRSKFQLNSCLCLAREWLLLLLLNGRGGGWCLGGSARSYSERKKWSQIFLKFFERTNKSGPFLYVMLFVVSFCKEISNVLCCVSPSSYTFTQRLTCVLSFFVLITDHYFNFSRFCLPSILLAHDTLRARSERRSIGGGGVLLTVRVAFLIAFGGVGRYAALRVCAVDCV